MTSASPDETPRLPSTTASTCDRREHDRIPGPFDGLRVGALETPVTIFDLSRGGCFINSMHEQQVGIVFPLKIDLPREGWITVKAQTLYRRADFGFAVQFIEVAPDAAERLDRALRAIQEREPSE